MIFYEEALQIINKKIIPIESTKEVPLLKSTKHICAQTIKAIISIPPTNIALKDGYAYTNNSKFEVSTGDNLNDDVKFVIPFEEDGYKKTPPKFSNIKQKAEDIKKDEILIKKGDFIHAYTITALAAEGFSKIKVYNRPKVSILSIGDNLCPIQKKIKQGEVYNSNALSLAARILENGGSINKVWQSANSFEDIEKCLKELAKSSDFIITTGAMSIKDAMSKMIYKDDFKLLFHKIQIAPASPSALTYFESIPVLHLPGLPLSSLLGFELLGVPILKTLKHEKNTQRKSILTKNKDEFFTKENCVSAIPGYFNGKNFKSAPTFGAGMLNTLSKCNGFVLIKNRKTIKKNDIVEFFTF